MREILIETHKLCKSFHTGCVTQHVLKNLDLAIYDHDFTVIMGSSGSRKSTLLYALSGMDIPSMGDVILCGENISKRSNDELALIRRKHCGFIFQSIYLLENMNVIDNVLTSLYLPLCPRLLLYVIPFPVSATQNINFMFSHQAISFLQESSSISYLQF
ncbi:MAG: ATP-binding cassette domain-containing protein [Lachnospiraceae bacterium]|nr:ATP-binding cassette domain-containing protein [Lachnospiraceae bacterium]